MPRYLLTLLAILLCSIAGFSQQITLSGQVKDTGFNKPVAHAVVALVSPTDSVLTAFTRTDADGKFKLQHINPASYSLMVMHPQFADYVDDINLSADKDIATIPLTAKSKLLEAVILRSTSPIRIKGDTTIYTADSFKVGANANVEELLKKMPGFQVDKNGQIKSMGEVVEKVLVDGEEFFGDDPGMAVKNLRADAVKEVQVFNKKSDQAEFTGIDDGKTKKTINLKLKDDKKRGYFGKIDLAGGLQNDIPDRYNTNTMLSAFKGKRKFTGFLLSGNTGQDGLSWEDQEKFGGENDNFSMSMDDDGGMMFISKGGGNDEEPYVNTQNGFIKNINSGIQYSNTWNDKHKFNLSPKFNSQVYDNNENKFTLRRLPGDKTISERSNTNSYVNRYNLKNSLSYDLKIDTSNSLKITLRANFYKTQSEDSINMQRYGSTNELLNSTDKRVSYDNDKTAISSSVLFRHKFKKARRTLSFNSDFSLLQQDGKNYLASLNKDYETGSPAIIEVDQLRDNEKSNTKNTARFVYTEPVGKRYSIELSHELALIRGYNKQLTYTYTPSTQKYDEAVDSLTNDFVQHITVNTPTAKLLFNGKKIKFNVGGGISLTSFDLEDRTNGKHYERNYSNFAPAANFTYNYKSNHSLRVNYNGNTSQPSVNQLQPLRNINDQYNQYIGNPDLKPSFTHSINVSHNGYNFIKDRWMYQSLYIRVQDNAIMNKLDYQGGKLVTQPVNTDGNYNLGMWSGIGFKSKKIDTRFNIGPHFNYSRNADIVNGQKTFSKIGQYGVWIDIQKSKDKKYDFSLNNDFGYNHSRSSNNNQLSSYLNNRASLSATVYYKKVWSVQTDYAYTYNQKVNAFAKDFTNQLWNATLKKTFKDNTYTAYFSVRDILNQNNGFQQNYYGTTYTETRNDRLKRYWMIGFRWDFKNKAATPSK